MQRWKPAKFMGDYATKVCVAYSLKRVKCKIIAQLLGGTCSIERRRARRDLIATAQQTVRLAELDMGFDQIGVIVNLPSCTSTRILPLISNPASSNHLPESRIQGAGGKSGKNLT